MEDEMSILLPKQYLEHKDIAEMGGPLLFLMGPIRGGGDWQADACELIFDIEPNALIACPCRWPKNHRLSKHFLDLPVDETRGRQLSWERLYLQLAGTGRSSIWEDFYVPSMPKPILRGCILCWLPEESKKDPHPGPEPYAMDTRGELGEWRAKVREVEAHVVVGSSGGFHGLSQIQRNFEAELRYPFRIHKTLGETVSRALFLASPLFEITKDN